MFAKDSNIEGRATNGMSFPMDSRGNRVSIFDTIDEKRIWRTLDKRILPCISLLYLLSFLDRCNIGNAKIAGMSKDLHLHGLRYNIAASFFFITYGLAEIPSNIFLKLTRPSLWFPAIMIAWGTIVTLTSLVNSFRGLLIARLALGIAEGGLFPGIAYYITMWYPRQIQGKRLAIFFSAATIAGAFGGVFACLVGHLDGKAGLHGWRWIFLIEGLTTVVVALLAFRFLNDYPETARFLTEDERWFVIQALREDLNGQATYFSRKFIWQALTDWRAYILILIHMCTLVPAYSIALFLPTIIHDLGYSAARAQLMTVPPFVCSCILTIIFGVYSDKLRVRSPFILLGDVISLIGFIMAYMTSSPGVGYAASIIATSGVFPTIPVILTWAGGNAGGEVKRAVVFGMVIGFGNFAGIIASFIYYQPPRFHQGHGTVIGCLCTSILITLLLMWKYCALNKEKEELCIREGIVDSMRDRYRELGDESPLFRYVI